MKHITLSIAFAVLSLQLLMAQTTQDNSAGYVSEVQYRELCARLDSVQNGLTKLNMAHSATNAKIQKLSGSVVSLNRAVQSLTDENSEVQSSVESLRGENSELRNQQRSDAEDLNQKIDDTKDSIATNLKNHVIWGIVIAAVILVILAVALWCLSKRLKNETTSVTEVRKAQDALRDAQTRLQEDSVKLDNKLIELLEKQMFAVPSIQSESEVDHSLTLKVADEIVRIELNLSRMDSSIRGYKQLSKAVQRIKDNFAANGYEIVDMLGKPYHIGMNVVANFVPDESLPLGSQIITGIIKPQINYNGKMIQSAQITVSQNI
ncbi:MAG: hypothetical protein LUC91_00085 [Prevotella sp.]|nr:hypothetical protein [Prevotella sp.]